MAATPPGKTTASTKIIPEKSETFGISSASAWRPAGSSPEIGLDEKLLYQAQKMEALGTLVAGVAHEINNPMNLIIYSMPILKKVWLDFLPVMKRFHPETPSQTYGGLTVDYLQENLGQILSDVELAADRVTKIVSDLKNFARQTDVTSTAPMHVNQAVKNALRLCRTTIKKSKALLDLDLDESIPCMEGNQQSIEQITLNLLINAVQAVEDTGGRIGIRTEFLAESGEVCIEVTDNGCGIHPDIAHRIFDPFVTSKQDQGGTGLGLAVTYSLVRAHKGDIRFGGLAGGGTFFSVSFPISPPREKIRILVVDDENPIREVVVNALSRNTAYEVSEASNGINACIQLGSLRPDLLILDIFMPEMNGLEVCRVIRSDPALADLKVIVTTGYPEDRMISEISRLGVDTILHKPFKVKQLIETVEGVLASDKRECP